MRDQRKPFAEIMDVFGFRIVTEDVASCYRILGVVHNLYKPVPGRFKDYIAIPKANGYQSLHTTLFGPRGMPIEVQIRTREMEAMANNGIAAHWLYKAGQTDHPIAEGSRARARAWVKGLLEMQRHAGDSLEFIEHVKNDLFPDDIYVFTPKGDIMELPQGATVIDFAYSVHTAIGNNCIACRIDRQLAPLSTRLESGQTLDIITAPAARPNVAWLNFVATAKARSAIRHALKYQQQKEAMQLGRRLLNKALSVFETSVEELDAELIQRALGELAMEDQDALLESIGLGRHMAYVVARHLMDLVDGQSAPSGREAKSQQPVVISDSEGMVTNFARCCHPLPGDAVVGHLSAGKGLVVHRAECKNLTDKHNPDKLFTLVWSDSIDEDFPVALRIEIESRRGLVAELASLVTDAGANIEGIGIEERDARLSSVNLTLAVKGRVHLARIIKRIRNLHSVEKIYRLG
jgi:GTP pyrophosphokinase